MDGIILAAGYSSRFQGFKMTEKVRGKPLILHTIDTMRSYVETIYVITGHQHAKLDALLKDQKQVKVVFNSSYDEGMFSSVKCGLRAVKGQTMLIPGDCAFVSKLTYESLIGVEGQVVIPSFQQRAGHPVVLSERVVFDVIRSDALHLRGALEDYEKVYVSVSDPYVLVDIDTREDLRGITGEGS